MNDNVRMSQMPQPTGRRNARMAQTVRDMVISLGLVIAVVIGVMLITLRPQPEAIKVVDISSMRAAAAQDAGFAVLAPTAVEGLQATSVRWQPTEASQGVQVWHIGYVLDGETYVQVSQAATADPAYLAEQTAGGRPVGDIQIMGTSWQKRESSKRRSLVLERDGVTTIVSGTASWDRLPTIAAALAAA